MSKRGNVELYIFLAFAVVALVGLTYTMLNGSPEGMAYQFTDYYASDEPDQPGLDKMGTQGSVSDMQADCFGTAPGMPRMGQQPLAGKELRDCLANAQAGISSEQQDIQECYTCTCEKLTAENLDQAKEVCKKSCGSEATIDETKTVPGLCQY